MERTEMTKIFHWSSMEVTGNWYTYSLQWNNPPDQKLKKIGDEGNP